MTQIDKIGRDAFARRISAVSESEFKPWQDLGTDEHPDTTKKFLEELRAKAVSEYEDGVAFPIADFIALTEWEWFERAWVIQKIAVAKDVVFACGNQRVP